MAIRHTLGSLAFQVIVQIDNFHQSHRSTASPDYLLLLEIAGFLVIYLLYRITSRYCCYLLFPDSVSSGSTLEKATLNRHR